ncbi:MAG: putative toxin-antitoxin system toxin component, PIN family [Chitinispirillaceae bacterium]|nr:putative toxin-antitoxin system toxin component, PIN family [Chitinispirillaceae bacterium]
MRRSGRDTTVVLDTNVLISYFWSSATCMRIVRALLLEDRFSAVISPAMIQEFDDVVSRPKIKRIIGELDAKLFRREYLLSAIQVFPQKTVSLCKDPNDNMMLECAVESGADFLVSGDKDLLRLGSIGRTRIVTPAWFIDNILGA